MDKLKPKKSTSQRKLKWGAGGAIIVFALVYSFWQKNDDQVYDIDESTLIFDTVMKGDLVVSVDGYGKLASAEQQLVTALTAANVKLINLRAGAVVSADSVIAVLTNPELEQALIIAKQALNEQLANVRQLQVNQQIEDLNKNAELKKLQGQLELATLKTLAQANLAEAGIISQVDYREQLLNERHLNDEVVLFEQLNQKLKAVKNEALNIENEKVKLLQSNVEIAQQRVDALQVRAGMAGVVQRLSVEIGQAVTAGQEVALIGSVYNLNAEIRVPQSKADLIKIGQLVLIDTRADTIEGTVARIDPVVTENTVLIEVALPEKLPDSVRPQLSVDGKIIVEVLKDTLYVKRPSHVLANSDKGIFVLDKDGKEATLVGVRFGQEAGQYIQVKEGVLEQSRVVLNDLTKVDQQITTLAVN